MGSCWGWQLEGCRIPELQSSVLGALSAAGPKGSLHILQGSFTRTCQSLGLIPGVFISSCSCGLDRSACRSTQTRDHPVPSSCRVISSTRTASLKGKSSFPVHCRLWLERSEAVVLEYCSLGLQSRQLLNVFVCSLEGNMLPWHIYLVGTLIHQWHTILVVQS